MESPLAAWESFYVIVGTSAAALTGLQFVVVALIVERDVLHAGQLHAFVTPTIAHFCVVLLVSATMSAPWPELWGASLVLGVTGALGVVYALLVARRAHRQTGVPLVPVDWIWYAALPLAANALLLAGALAVGYHSAAGPFIIATTSLLLLFIGIHNAWDTVTYVAEQEPKASGHTPDASAHRPDGPNLKSNEAPPDR